MRQRLLSYLTAACINLSIVGGTLVPAVVERHPIIRLRARPTSCGPFAEGELTADGSVVVMNVRALRTIFGRN
jgi:hypothetical protein